MATTSDSERGFRPGDVVDGRYSLKREIARGGTCVVHEAEHVHLGARVALKSPIEPRMDTRRLLREGRALSAARHPGIAVVYDAGLDSAGAAYLALEMIEGRSLDGLLSARGRFDPPSAVAVLGQLSEALDHAHAERVVHRDVKPSNLMISRDAQGAERVTLIDFGIASIGDVGPTEPKLTHAGDRLGTYDYIPPEQFLGEPTDARADVYSTTATFYEMISGQVPFPGGQAGAAEAALVGKTPGTLATHVGAAARDLDPVIARGLARRPEDRFSGVGELYRAILSALGLTPRPLVLLEAAKPVAAVSGRDARRFARAPYVTPARVLREGKPPVDGRTEDVSEGGLLLIVAGDSVADGERVQVRFSLPTSSTVASVHATTRWVRGNRAQAALGLSFEDLPGPAATDIRGFVAWMRA